MSVATLERAILAETRTLLSRPGLRKQDILVWSTGPVTPEAGEIAVFLPELKVNVVVPALPEARR